MRNFQENSDKWNIGQKQQETSAGRKSSNADDRIDTIVLTIRNDVSGETLEEFVSNLQKFKGS